MRQVIWRQRTTCLPNFSAKQTAERSSPPTVPPYGLGDITSYDQFEITFRELLNDKLVEWEKSGRRQPPFLDWLERGHSRTASVSGKKMLFLIPQYIQNSTKFIEADFKDHLLDTAANAGADVQMFPTDLCSYPEINLDKKIAKTELLRLSDRIAEFRPDIVVVDGNYMPTRDSLNPDLLNELKTKFNFKVIVFIGDAWGRPWIAPADSWSLASDVIYHFAPDSPLETECQFPEKLCWDAYLVNERNFFPDPQKDLDISFVGTSGSDLRPFWLTAAIQTADEWQLRHRLKPHKREAGVALTIDEYAKVLRRSTMVLNFSSRYDTFKMMTGRTWQAMTAGVVLLDEVNRFTPFYFEPFIHYVPFSTRKELAFAMRFFARNDDCARQIGKAAAAFCRQHYSSDAIWSRLIGAAYAADATTEDTRSKPKLT